MIKYKANRYLGGTIKQVEIERETASNLWVNGCRRAKKSSYDCFFDTWEEAHAYLLDLAEMKLESARRGLENAQGMYGNVKGLTPELAKDSEDG